MASVSGLLQVRVRQAKGLDAAPAAALTVRLRLLPWKEEQSSDTAQCDDDGTAEWALSDANLVVLPHLAAHDEAQPQLSIDLRSRELLVYERCLGLTTIDAQPLLIPGEENDMWISLTEKTSVLLQTKFVPGTTTPTAIARTPSLVLNEDVRHQHLFRLQSYNTPQWCAVCERLMVGLRHQGFRCEACGLSVHGGCQLKAHAVFDCVGKKPPPLETPQPSFDEPLVQGSPRAKRSPSGDAVFVDDVEEGVGRLELHLASVKLLETSDEEDTTTGDYYVRVVLAGSRDMPPPKRGRFNRRTHTVYQSREPHFDVRWRFCVESFAAEVRVELVDAARDAVVGSHRFGVLDLLQEQADQKALDYLKQAQSIIKANLPPGTQIPYLTQSESAKRYGSPPSSYYFEDPANSYLRDKSNLPTAVVTWPSAHFTVFGDKLWWAPTPISVERPPQPEQFSIEISKQHIRRATDCVHAIYAFMDAYDAFMRWHKPLRTGSVFVVFVSICLFLDAEYAGLVPVTLVALGLLVLGRRRFLRGYPRASFLDEAFEKADAELLNGATQRFRPCGRLKIAVCAGRGFEKDDDVYAVATFRRPLVDEPVVEKPRPRSGSASPRIAEALSVDTSLDALLDDAQALPTPGAAQGTKARGDSIMLDDAPLPVSPTTTKVEEEEITHHETLLGYTGTCRGRDPRWHGSLGATVDREAGWSSIRRVSSLLGDHDHATPCIVEPWERRGWRKNDTSQTIDRCLVYPLPQPMDAEQTLAWSEAQGGVRVAVFRTGRLADSCIGEVVIPLCDLVDNDERGPQRERRGWHELEIVDEEVPKKRKEKPAVHVRLQLVLRDDTEPSDDERRLCRAVEAMIDPVTSESNTLTQSVGAYAREATKPLSTVVTANEYAVYAQNLLGRILDFGEGFKNLLTWTHPEKTLFLFLCACFGVVLFARVQTRYLILAGGLYEFLYRLLPGDGSPMTTRLVNAVRSVPHDRALRDCYDVRAKEHAQLLIENEKRMRRRAQLHAIWSPSCEIRCSIHLQDKWQDRYVILHGRRLAGWGSEKDVDAGRAPREVLVLLGHAGLTAPSPTDCRDLDEEASTRVLVVFGQDQGGKPARWAVLCAEESLSIFKDAVGGACATKLE